MRLTDIPQPVLTRAKAIVADTIAVIAAGMQTPEMASLRELHVKRVASGPCSLIGAHERTNSLDAALLNGTAGDAWRIGDAPLGGFNGIPQTPVINWPGRPGEALTPDGVFYLAMALVLLVYFGCRALLVDYRLPDGRGTELIQDPQ